jgi:hypothetical protein
MLSAMDRKFLDKLAARNDVDVETIVRVSEELARIAAASAGSSQYSIVSPLGRPAERSFTQQLSNAVTTPHAKLGLTQR